ncbi:MAG: GH39 family glycosyl hydrolase, partial [Thermomicrobiales bacterium]
MNEQEALVNADFSVAVDPPLVRKFGVMNSGLVSFDRHRRDLCLLPEIAPDSLRIDLCWGEPRAGWSEEPVQGTSRELRYHFAEMDELAKTLNGLDVLPYWSYCYTPPPLQHSDWRSGPNDLVAWGKVLHDFAKHYRDAGITVGYHEVYNEPDLPGVFFTGTMDEYFEIYAYGARGLKAGDPDARVGGPALANTHNWTLPFLDFVEQWDLPLDFFSFHVLNPGWPDGTLENAFKRLDQLRKDFGGRERFLTTEVHVNEYHPYEYGDTHRGGAADKHALAAHIFTDFEGLLEKTDLSLVHWAQFMSSLPGVSDEGMGLLDLEGHRKAAFNAFQIYARMPIDRRLVSTQKGLRAMASVDNHRGALVLWNETGRDQRTTVRLVGLPFAWADLQVFRVDREHASYGDDPSNEELRPTEKRENLDTVFLEWTGDVPDGGVVFLELQNRNAPHETFQQPAQVLYVRRFYPNRGASSYADFDRHTWTARLGMG